MKNIFRILGVVTIMALLLGSSVVPSASAAAGEPSQVGLGATVGVTEVPGGGGGGGGGIPESPQYGGVMVLAKIAPPVHFDDALGLVSMSPTLALTNEDLLMGDWARGPAGTGNTTWIYPSPPALYNTTGCIAESFEITGPDTVVFHVRHGIHFHNKPPTNGREVTADDVIFSLTRLWQTSTSYQYSALPWATHIQSITAPDAWTIVIQCLPGKLAAVYQWAGSASKIVPPEVVSLYGNLEDWNNSCGTGPFILTDYVDGASVTFVKNSNYWGHDPLNPSNQIPYVDGVKWYIITDLSTRISALRTGKIDVLDSLTWGDAQSLMGTNPELQWTEYPGFGTNAATAIFMRTDNQTLPFADIRIRKALSLGIDHATIRDIYFGGHADILAWPIMPTAEFSDVYTPLGSLPQSVQELYGYNPDKAKQLLAEAGYPQGFKTSVICLNNSASVNMASVVKAYWAQIGVDLEIQPREVGAWRSIGFNRTYLMYMDNVNATNPFAFSNLTPGALMNFSMVDDATINSAHQAIDAAYFDETLRRQLMKDIVPYILEQSYVEVAPVPHLFTAWQPWVRGYHGENTVGFLGAIGNFPKYVWLNQAFAPWSVPMAATTPSQGSNLNLELGTRVNASDGYDSGVDVPHSPPAPGSTAEAYFSITNPLFPQLDRDYRALASSMQWTLHAQSSAESITLTWNTGSVPSVLSAYMNTGLGSINMRAQNQVVLPAGTYNITIRISTEMEVPIPLKAGWNMVSVPVVPQDTSVNSVFAGTEIVYTWDPVSKSYYVPTVVEPSKGYWVAVVSDRTLTIRGVPVYGWTANLTAGWNMIGSIYGSVVDFISPNDDPDLSVEAFTYWWNPATKSYIYGDTIEPGKGYWVAATQSCTLTLSIP